LKTNIGGNACTAASFALAESAASLFDEQLFLYLAKQFHGENVPEKFKLLSPCFNILNGGKRADGKLKLQKFMLSPSRKFAYPDQLRVVAEVYQKLGALLAKEYDISAKNRGDEGGFAHSLDTPEQALLIIQRAV
jgi:enolase